MVLDDNGTPVPPGFPGELVIRGAHVMQGYWENEPRPMSGCVRGRTHGRGCFIPVIFFKSMTKAFSTSSAAKTTS